MLPICSLLIDDEYDRNNFKRIYDRYADDVFKRIYQLLNNRQDAEDVMQETWLAIAENIKFYRAKDDDSMRAYILRIAKNRAITFYHAREKEKAHLCEEELTELTDGCDDERLLFDMCDKMDAHVICECINALDEIYGDVLNAYYLHGHTVKEIAKLFKLKEVTVRARLSRGRKKLLQMLERRNLNDR